MDAGQIEFVEKIKNENKKVRAMSTALPKMSDGDVEKLQIKHNNRYSALNAAGTCILMASPSIMENVSPERRAFFDFSNAEYALALLVENEWHKRCSATFWDRHQNDED